MNTQKTLAIGLMSILGWLPANSRATLIFSSPGPHIIDQVTDEPGFLLTTSITRDAASSDTLFFRATVDPTYNMGGTDFAGLMLYNGNGGGSNGRIGIGNYWASSSYSLVALGSIAPGDVNLVDATTGSTRLVLAADSNITLAFRIQYNALGDDTLTAWLNPDFSIPDTAQAFSTTIVKDLPFDRITLREGGGSGGWTFTDVRVATTPQGIGFVPEPSTATLGLMGCLLLLRGHRRLRAATPS